MAASNGIGNVISSVVTSETKQVYSTAPKCALTIRDVLISRLMAIDVGSRIQGLYSEKLILVQILKSVASFQVAAISLIEEAFINLSAYNRKIHKH